MVAAQQTDFWGQFEVAEYDKPQYDEQYWGQYDTVSQNQHALESSLKELPEDDPYVQTQKQQTEQLANMLFTKQELDNIKSQGKIGWMEYRQRGFIGWSDIMPFVGTGKEAYKAGKTLAIAKKLENGEEISDADKAYMKGYLRDYVELQMRGMTWGTKGASMFLQAPAFMAEFALTGGLGEVAAKGAIKAASKGASVVALKGSTKAAARIAGQQAVLVPSYAIANYNERKIADGLKTTDKGEMLFDESGNLHFSSKNAESGKKGKALKALGTGEIQILSELTGGLIGQGAGKLAGAVGKQLGKVTTTNTARGISAVSAKIYNSLPKNTRVKLEAAVRLAENAGKSVVRVGEKMKANPLAQGGGFHGVAEEMAEERVADILMTAFDLDDEQGYSGDQFLNAICPSPQQLLLEAGVFSIVGASSLATRTVFNDLKSKGYSEKEATVITQNLSEIEKENMANDILGEVKINEDITEEEVKQEAENIQLKLFGGVEMNVDEKGEEVAADVMYDMADTAGATPREAELAKKEWQEKGTDSKYFKKWFGDSKVVDENGKPLVVYYGSNVEFDTFKNTNKRYKSKYGNVETNGIRGFYFTPDLKSAEIYSEIREGTPNIKEFYLALKNPIYFTDYADISKITEETVKKLKQQGYDGAIYYDRGEFGEAYSSMTEYVAFEPNQIKSVDNQGTFDESNPNIYYDVEGGRTRKTIQKSNKDNIKPINIEEGSVPKFDKISQLKSWITENLNLIGDVTIKQNGRIVQFSKSNISRSMKGVNRSEVKRDSYSKLKELVENAIYDKLKENDEKHPNVKGQEIYYNKFNYNGETYGIEIAVDIPKSKNTPYTYAGHKIKIAPAATRVSSNELTSNRPSANNIITDNAQNLNPPVNNSLINKAEVIEDELETPETVADKIIRGESKFGKFYTEWVDRFTPIENLVKKAEQKTGEKLDTSTNPYYQARMYAGLVESIKQQVNDKTFVKENGKIKITGEGFLPIINDYVAQVKDIEPDYDKAIEDLSDYLIANRYLLDLKDREGYEATEEQKLKALKDMTNLNLKYGNKIDDISKIADRIYAFNQRILHNLVDSGNMSQETYDKIIEQNPHHISYKRVMDDNGIGQDFFAKSKFTDAKSPVKRIKGSERDIQNIFVSTLEDVSRILDVAERNKVARSIADLKNILPEYIQDKKPAMEKRTALVKVNYDAKMRQQLLEAIKYFGRTFENVKSIKTPTGYALGSYSEAEKLIRKKLGSQDRTLAHEVGHMLDFALDIENKIKKNSAIMKELQTLAEDRFESVIKLQDGEFVTEDAGSSENYKNYAKTNKEMIANAFDLYFTSRDYVKRVAPKTAKYIDNLFKGEYAFLNDIRPSTEVATEEIEKDVWTPSRNKPYGNVIQYFVEGKPKFIEVTKPVMDAVDGLNSQEIDFVNKFLVGSATMLRTGATITPEFAIRNFIRDQESATIYIKDYNPFIDGVKGLFNVLGKKVTGKNETYDEWVKAGGAFGSYMELKEKSVNKALKEFVGEGSKMRSIFSYANPLKLAEEFSQIFEQATRLGMYTRSKMNGATAMEAALEAREGTLDFSRSGSQGRIWNRKLPFFNAGIQGVDKMVRTFRDHPYLSSIKAIATMTIPQIALTGYYLYAAPDDDREEYLNIPQYQKDFFYCFKIGYNWLRIPKDFTLGYLFGSVPERFITWAYQEKKPEGKELWDMTRTLFGSVSPINNPTDVLPPLLRALIEDVANYDFFRGQHIYPEYMNNLEPSMRANKFNSETSKWLGEKLNMSPAKIDHTISSLLGTSGKYLTDAGDLMINSVREFNGEEINKKVSTTADAPFIRGFVIRDPVGYQAVSTNEFFENYKTVSEKHASYNKLVKSGERDAAREYKTKHNAELRAYDKLNNTKKRIGDIGNQMDKIYSNKNMTNKEKQERLQPLAKMISDMAFDANVWYGEFTKE